MGVAFVATHRQSSQRICLQGAFESNYRMASDTSNELTISGTVIFTNDEPESPLPNPSILKVKLEDCRLADADSIGVAEVTIDAHEVYVKGQPLKYTMKIQNVSECPCFGVSK